MPDNHIIPVSSGLFEHRSRVGPAIWEFLWCIDAVSTEEIDDSGMHWGLVHGGAPIKHERIALEIDSSKVTVQRNLAILKNQGYINSVRTARGEIIKVAKNKKGNNKKSDIKNDSSLKSDTSNLIVHSERVVKNDSSDESELSKMTTLKDFKDLTITTAITYPEFNPENKSPLLQLLESYCQLNYKIDIHVKPKEREAMGKMVAGGMPNPFTIRTMEILLEEKREREGNSFKFPSSFLYYENGIWEAWRNENAQTVPVPSGEVAPGKAHKNKQNQVFDMLDQIAEEERAREQSGSD